VTRRPVGRVIRVAESPARGTMVLQGVCTCRWRSDRLETRDHGSAQLNAPATNQVARLVLAHFRADHPDLE
jgi:hypothetical protein